MERLSENLIDGHEVAVCYLAIRKENTEEERSEVKVEFTKNMGEHAGIRVVHRSGSKLNFRLPVITNDSK